MNSSSLAHCKWEWQYYVVFIPKFRRKKLYGTVKDDVRDIIKTLCSYKKVEIIAGAVCADHVHLCVSIPPKLSISDFVGYLKGKSALMIFDKHPELGSKWDRSFWVRGYYVATVAIFDDVKEALDQAGLIMRGGTIVDATLIATPSSTKNQKGERDPEMHQTRKGNQWYFGMKVHIGVDAGTGCVHTVTATAANVHDVDEVPNLIREDDEVMYGDSGYLGVENRKEIAEDEHLSSIDYRIAKRPSSLKTTNAFRASTGKSTLNTARRLFAVKWNMLFS